MANPPNNLKNVLNLLKTEKNSRYAKDPQQIRRVLPWDEWIASPYYSGYYSTELYPYWKAKISNFFKTGCTEFVITGCIGGGKTWAANALIAYKIYTLSCYTYPQRLFNLSTHSTMVFAYLTVTQKKAQLAGFAELRDALDSIPYFQKEFRRNMDLSTRLEWNSHSIIVVGGSSAQDVLSLNLMGIILDEVNFYRKGGSGAIGDVKRAQADYADTTHRRRSRYIHKGIDHSFSVLISSATVDSSFTNKRIQEGQENKQLKQMVATVTQWEAKAGVENFSDINFAVFAGNDTTDAKLIETPEDFLSICPGNDEETARVSQALSEPDVIVDDVFNALSSDYRERCKLIPEDFLMDFKTDLLKAIQNIAGMSVGDAGKFFTSKVLWNASCNLMPSLRHPFSKEILQITTLTPTRMEDLFLPDVLFDPDTKKFKRHPNAKRFVHIDQSETGDDTGIGMVHFAGLKETESGLILPLIEMDFAIGISNTQKPDRIDLAKILNFLLWLRREYYVKFGKISYDKYASNYQIQILDKMRIPTGLVSVDKSDAPWKLFRSLLDDQRFSQYHYKPFKDEIFGLIHDRVKQKVDHTSSGAKDISDGVVGAISACVADIDKGSLDTTKGYKDNTKIFSSYRQGGSNSLEKSSWIFADYEKRTGMKVTDVRDVDLQITSMENYKDPKILHR